MTVPIESVELVEHDDGLCDGRLNHTVIVRGDFADVYAELAKRFPLAVIDIRPANPQIRRPS